MTIECPSIAVSALVEKLYVFKVKKKQIVWLLFFFFKYILLFQKNLSEHNFFIVDLNSTKVYLLFDLIYHKYDRNCNRFEFI